MQRHKNNHGECYRESNLERECIGEEGRDGKSGWRQEKDGEGICGWKLYPILQLH